MHDPSPLTFIATASALLAVIYYMGTSKPWISFWTAMMGAVLVFEGVGMAVGIMAHLR